MKEIPPSRASATAMRSPDTDCMIAEVNGTRSDKAGNVASRYRTNGTVKSTFPGTQFSVVRLGRSRYSPKVREGDSRIVAIIPIRHCACEINSHGIESRSCQGHFVVACFFLTRLSHRAETADLTLLRKRMVLQRKGSGS